MGTVTNSVTFEGPLPDLAEITHRAAEIVGLPVEVIERETDSEELYEVYVLLELAGARQTQIELVIHAEDAESIAEPAAGPEETGTSRAVHLKSYEGQPPFLFDAIILALESLGGRPAPPVHDEIRRRHEKPIAVVELATWGTEARRKPWWRFWR